MGGDGRTISGGEVIAVDLSEGNADKTIGASTKNSQAMAISNVVDDTHYKSPLETQKREINKTLSIEGESDDDEKDKIEKVERPQGIKGKSWMKEERS